MDLLSGIFTAFGLSASTGLNAYLPLLVVSLLARFTDWITLSQPWDTLESWWVIGVLAALSLVEFFADKVPTVNHINDAIQTFVRPAAGAIAFAASAKVVTDVNPALAELRATFSKPMQAEAGSWSWNAWDDTHFPETAGQPRYLPDGRTCVLPVKLKPDWSYQFMLNSDRFHAFQSQEGVPLAPVTVSFKTGG